MDSGGLFKEKVLTKLREEQERCQKNVEHLEVGMVASDQEENIQRQDQEEK
jgi:hypothetical protein